MNMTNSQIRCSSDKDKARAAFLSSISKPNDGGITNKSVGSSEKEDSSSSSHKRSSMITEL